MKWHKHRKPVQPAPDLRGKWQRFPLHRAKSRALMLAGRAKYLIHAVPAKCKANLTQD